MSVEEDKKMEINIPDVVAEVRAAFEKYEAALISNNVDVLDELFWDSSYTIRYGVNEILYGYEAIYTFRRACGKVNLERVLMNTVITLMVEILPQQIQNFSVKKLEKLAGKVKLGCVLLLVGEL